MDNSTFVDVFVDIGISAAGMEKNGNEKEEDPLKRKDRQKDVP